MIKKMDFFPSRGSHKLFMQVLHLIPLCHKSSFFLHSFWKFPIFQDRHWECTAWAGYLTKHLGFKGVAQGPNSACSDFWIVFSKSIFNISAIYYRIWHLISFLWYPIHHFFLISLRHWHWVFNGSQLHKKYIFLIWTNLHQSKLLPPLDLILSATFFFKRINVRNAKKEIWSQYRICGNSFSLNFLNRVLKIVLIILENDN